MSVGERNACLTLTLCQELGSSHSTLLLLLFASPATVKQVSGSLLCLSVCLSVGRSTQSGLVVNTKPLYWEHQWAASPSDCFSAVYIISCVSSSALLTCTCIVGTSSLAQTTVTGHGVQYLLADALFLIVMPPVAELFLCKSSTSVFLVVNVFIRLHSHQIAYTLSGFFDYGFIVWGNGVTHSSMCISSIDDLVLSLNLITSCVVHRIERHRTAALVFASLYNKSSSGRTKC